MQDRRHIKTMTKNRLDIQTILTKRTDFQTDRVLVLGLVTETEEKVHPSHLLKFLLANPHCTILVLPYPQADTSQNQKSAIFAKEVFLTKNTGPECLSFSYSTFQNLKQHSRNRYNS